MFGFSDVVFDHALQLIPAQQQTVMVQCVAGTLSCTVLDVVSLIQNQDLSGQVDFHLVQTNSKPNMRKGKTVVYILPVDATVFSSTRSFNCCLLTLSLIIGSSR